MPVKFQSPRGVGVVQTEIPDGVKSCYGMVFQSPRGVGVVQTSIYDLQDEDLAVLFQSPRGVGVVQTANPRACMVMRQTGI